MEPQPQQKLAEKPGAWVDLALTLPIFVAYHMGVIFLNVHNAADIVTYWILRAAVGSRELYILFTLAIGVVFTGVFAWLGRGEAFRTSKFVQIALEGMLYAYVMRLCGAFVVGEVFAGNSAIASQGKFAGAIMSLGAGFYEELAFRVLLFAGGAKILGYFFSDSSANPPGKRAIARVFLVKVIWAVVCAGIFSFVHYTGALGDGFDVKTFVFRMVLGLTLTLIFVTRGFAAAVWAHAAYDIWVLVL
ncbi:MAG: CPBP family glutamic-type intramembrane protease [Polyangiaceae bacterium]